MNKKPLNLYLLAFFLIVSTVSVAKTYKYKNLNFSIKLKRSWKEESDTNKFNKMFYSKKSLQSLFISKIDDLQLIENKMPTDKQGFLQFLSDNSSLKQKYTKMAENHFTIEPINSNNFRGFLANLEFVSDKSEFKIAYVGIVNKQHAFQLIFLNLDNTKILKEEVEAIVENIQILDMSKTIENTRLVITPKKSTYQSSYYGYEIPEIEGMLRLSNSDVGLSDEDSVFNFILYHQELKFKFVLSSYCLKEDALTEKQLLSYYIHGHEESLAPFTIKNKGSETYASGKLINGDSKVYNYYYKALTFDDCQHVIMYNDKVDRGVKPLLDFANLVKSIPVKAFAAAKEQIQENKKQAFRLSELGKNASNYNLSNTYKLFKKAVDLDPKNLDILKNFIIVSYKSTKYKEALTALNNAGDEIYEDVDLKSWKAWLLAETEDVSEALSSYNDIFKESFSNDIDFFRYLELLKTREKWLEILALIEKYKSNVSKQKSLDLALITAYYKTNNKVKATELLTKINDPNNISNYNILEVLDVYYLMELYEEGIKVLESQIENKIENANIYFYLGAFQLAQKHNELALESLNKALEFQPNNPEILNFINGINLSQGVGDIGIVKTPIRALEIPQIIKTDISKLTLSNHLEPVENYYYITGYEFIKNKKLTKTFYRKYRVNDLQSVEDAKTLKIQFNQDYEHPFINKFSVTNLTTNAVSELDINTVYITSAKDGIDADGDKYLNIPIPSIDNNTEIEYIISIQSNTPVTTFNLETEYFVSAREYKYMASFLRGDVNDVSSFYTANLQKIQSENLVVWKSDEIEKYKQESFTQDVHYLFDWLKISSIEKDWKALGDSYLQNIKDKLNTRLSKGLLLSITPDSKDSATIAKELARYVQSNITYQALEFGSRAQIPNKSDKTLQMKYGDCKDHAVLLHDLLTINGIKSQFALVSTTKYIHKEIYSLDQFDHLILYLPEINGGVFIDATDKYTPIDLATPPRSVHGSTALVLEENNSKLIEVPQITVNLNSINIDRVISQSKDKYIFTETAVINGYRASDLRSYLQPLNKEHINTEIMEWVHMYYSDITLRDFKYYNLVDLEKPLVLEFVFEQDKINSDFKVPAFFERVNLSVSYVENRKYPFEFNEPIQIHSLTTTQDSNLVLPNINKEFSSSSIKWMLTNNKKENAQEFSSVIQAGIYPANEFKPFIQATKTALFKIEKSIVIK